MKKILTNGSLTLIPFLCISTGCKNVEKSPSAIETSKRPNIILIMTDDQGYCNVGFHGNKDVKTPNIDRLASESVEFDHFYTSPVSAPTRAALLTGRYSLRTGLFDTFQGGAIMDTRETTVAELLSANGYQTAIFGKWHLGDVYPYRPQDQGFQTAVYHMSGGIGQPGDHPDNFYDNSVPLDERNHSYFDPVLMYNGVAKKTHGFCTDVFTNEALDFIDKADKDNPFFVYLSFNAPHGPCDAPEKYREMYRDFVPDASKYGEDAKHIFPVSDKNGTKFEYSWLERLKRVYAMITNIDDNVGRVMAKIREKGIEDNTLVIFMSDNGPYDKFYSANLHSTKSSVHEGGVRVPFILHYGKSTKGRVVHTPVAHIDILPTFAELCGVKVPDSLDIDGRSFLPLVQQENPTWEKRVLFSEWKRGYPNDEENVSAFDGRYKYVSRPVNSQLKGKEALYDLSQDPSELNNIAEQEPEIFESLKAQTKKWIRRSQRSEHLGIHYLSVGSEKEPTVILSRNDWHQAPNIDYGYWDTNILRTGLYDIELIFRQTPDKGTLVFNMGKTTFERHFAGGTKAIKLNDVFLAKGVSSASAFLRSKKLISPLYIKLTYKKEAE